MRPGAARAHPLTLAAVGAARRAGVAPILISWPRSLVTWSGRKRPT